MGWYKLKSLVCEWYRKTRPISKSDAMGLELLFVLYATNLTALNISEVSKIANYYNRKYSSYRIEKYFGMVAVKHAKTDAYKLSNLAWGHITRSET